MKTITFILILLTISLSGVSRTVDLNKILHETYSNKEYAKCYHYCKIIKNYNSNILHPQNLNSSSLEPLVKYSAKNNYLYDSLGYYELVSLKMIDSDKYFYTYFLRKGYLKKDSSYTDFINYYERINKSTNNLEDYYLNKKLNEIYNVLKDFDTIACNKIFKYDNSELINIVKNAKNILNLPSNDFHFSKNISDEVSRSFYNKENDIQIRIDNYFIIVKNNYRFVNENQLVNFLFTNKMTTEEKMFITFYFTKNYIDYNIKSGEKDLTEILCKREARCYGMSILFGKIMSDIGVENYFIKIHTSEANHVFNTITFNNEKYLVDITNRIYFKKISSIPDYKIVKVHSFKGTLIDCKIEYKSIKSYIASEIKEENKKVDF